MSDRSKIEWTTEPECCGTPMVKMHDTKREPDGMMCDCGRPVYCKGLCNPCYQRARYVPKQKTPPAQTWCTCGLPKERRGKAKRLICRPCAARRRRERYAANSEPVKESQRIWNAANSEAIRARSRKYYLANAERLREAGRRSTWRKDNPEGQP